MKIFCDFETTGKNIYQSEIITGYFLKENGESLDFKTQVYKWNDDAALIHNISYYEMMSYPSKQKAITELLDFLPKDFELICYANPNTELGYMLFDVAILQMNLMDYLELDFIGDLPVKIKGYSVYNLAKQCFKNGLFTPIKKEETNRNSFSQVNVYKALFNEDYNAHNAKQDVIAMKRIYDKLNYLKDNGVTLTQGNQLSLL